MAIFNSYVKLPEVIPSGKRTNITDGKNMEN